MAKKNDYGYFGSGITGYMHYKQAFDRNFGYNQYAPKSSYDYGSDDLDDIGDDLDRELAELDKELDRELDDSGDNFDLDFSDFSGDY